MYCDVNDEESNQRFISFDDYSVSEKVYTHDEAIKLQEALSERGFFVDESIAKAISELNRKGYVTKFCCGGHLLKDRKPITIMERKDILDFLPKRRQHLSPKNGYIKISEDDESISFLYNGSCSQSYVTFDETVELDSVPDGYFLDDDGPNNIIRANVDCCVYEAGEQRFINDEEARKYLQQLNENLLNWVISLPYKKASSIQK